MKIGIGVSLNPNGRNAAIDSVNQARKAVPTPNLALAFGSIHLNQNDVYSGLIDAGIDPAILIGGSSYAEISTAGVTFESVTVLLLDLPSAYIKTISVPLHDDPETMSRMVLDAIGDVQPGQENINVVFMLSEMNAGRANAVLQLLRNQVKNLAFFGGMSCGNYDLGMNHPDFWPNYQYGECLHQKHLRLAIMRLPRDQFSVAFGCGHGWEPLGPTHVVTRSEGSTVFEIDNIGVIDFYRQFLGRDADDHFFELLVQRYGLALQIEDHAENLTKVKIPVSVDRRKGSMMYFPEENLENKRVNLIQANRKSLISGARIAAEKCLSALDGRKPTLILAVSCSVRGSILHSRSEKEVEAVREVIGKDVPIIGWYSGGEIIPLLNSYNDVTGGHENLGGSLFHGTTIGLLAITSSEPPLKVTIPSHIERKSSGRDLEDLLNQSEETLDSTESFLSNLSRQVYHDGEQLRAQSDVLHRYTPHEVWSKASESAKRGEYEIADTEFNGAFLFMDIQGFTSYSEKNPPTEVIRALNALFEPATAIIYECGGDVDKYMGDCIFAAFQDKLKAVEAGRKILSLFVKIRRKGNPFNVRLGINAGRAIRANVGGMNRREYTFIGDAVNLAQRLESNCTPGRMLISEELYNLSSMNLTFVQRKIIHVKGKQESIVVYELGE